MKDLQNNDATSAFAGLIEAQSIESRAEKFKGSAPEEEDEEDKPKKPKKKPMPKIHAKKAKKPEIKAKKPTKKKSSKSDASLVGATEEMSESTEKAIEASADLPSTPEAAKKAEDPDLPTKKKKGDISKFLPKKKGKPAPKAAAAAADSEEIPKPKPEKPKKPAHKVAHKVKKDDMPPQLYQHSSDSLPFGALMK